MREDSRQICPRGYVDTFLFSFVYLSVPFSPFLFTDGSSVIAVACRQIKEPRAIFIFAPSKKAISIRYPCIKAGRKRINSLRRRTAGGRNECASGCRTCPQGDCVGAPRNDRRPIEMQMAAVGVISGVYVPGRTRLFQIRSRPSHPSPNPGCHGDTRTSGVVTKIPAIRTRPTTDLAVGVADTRG